MSHTLYIGSAGCGKTHLLKQHLLSNKENEYTVLFDTHGEYFSMKNYPSFSYIDFTNNFLFNPFSLLKYDGFTSDDVLNLFHIFLFHSFESEDLSVLKNSISNAVKLGTTPKEQLSVFENSLRKSHIQFAYDLFIFNSGIYSDLDKRLYETINPGTLIFSFHYFNYEAKFQNLLFNLTYNLLKNFKSKCRLIVDECFHLLSHSKEFSSVMSEIPLIESSNLSLLLSTQQIKDLETFFSHQFLRCFEHVYLFRCNSIENRFFDHFSLSKEETKEIRCLSVGEYLYVQKKEDSIQKTFIEKS